MSRKLWVFAFCLTLSLHLLLPVERLGLARSLLLFLQLFEAAVLLYAFGFLSGAPRTRAIRLRLGWADSIAIGLSAAMVLALACSKGPAQSVLCFLIAVVGLATGGYLFSVPPRCCVLTSIGLFAAAYGVAQHTGNGMVMRLVSVPILVLLFCVIVAIPQVGRVLVARPQNSPSFNSGS